MSDFREIEIIVNVIGKQNDATCEDARILCDRIIIDVSELMTLKEVMSKIEKSVFTIEDKG